MSLLFDRALLRRRRERACPGLAQYDFLFREAAARLADRLADTRRCFPLALDLGCHGGELARELEGKGGIERRVSLDLAAGMARAGGGLAVAGDEEALPFRAESFDLVISNLALHWANDLPGVLVQIRRILKPDGLFLASLAGAGTLAELREVLFAAELEEEGGVSPRISPFADLRDAGALLQRAGFALPVADGETITVRYGEPLRLMEDLRGMGESNTLLDRRRCVTRKETLVRSAALYRERYGGADGRVPASFQIITLTGWSPAPSQPKALRPGSAAARLAAALGTEEIQPK